VLEGELGQRIRIERAHILQRIPQAIDYDSNLAENQTAKTDQEVSEARIAELMDKLARAEVIDVSKSPQSPPRRLPARFCQILPARSASYQYGRHVEACRLPKTLPPKVRWMSMPITRRIRSSYRIHDGSCGRHDNYGFALSAQPGESQRRPANNSSSRLIVRIGLPTPSCSRCLCPDGRTICHDLGYRSRTLAPRISYRLIKLSKFP
jgi:hypothetical protein